MPHLLSPDCGQLITSHLLTFFLRRTLIFFIRGCLARTIGGNELECARTITDRCHQSGSRMSGRPGTYLLYIHQTSRHEQQVTPCPSGCTMPTATPTASSCLLRPPLPVTSCHSSLPQPPPTPKWMPRRRVARVRGQLATLLLLHIIAAVRRLPEHERRGNFPIEAYNRGGPQARCHDAFPFSPCPCLSSSCCATTTRRYRHLKLDGCV